MTPAGDSSDGRSEGRDAPILPPPDWWYPTSTGDLAQEPAGKPSPSGPHDRTSRWWRSEKAAAERFPRQRWGMGAALLVLAVNLVGFVIAALLVTDTASPALVPAIALPTLAAAAVAFGISWVRGNGPVKDFGLPRSLRELAHQSLVGLVCGVGALVGGIILALVLIALLEDVPQSVLEESAGMPLNARIALAMWVWLGAPFAEEIIFRGMLWGALERYRFFQNRGALFRSLSSNYAVLAITTVAFALWHVEFWRLAILLFAGTMMGVARLYTGSAFSSTVAHSVNNALPAIGILFMPELIP